MTPFDVENGAIQYVGTTLQPGSVTPSENNELIVTGLGFYPSGVLSVNSSFTISDQVNYVSSAAMGLGAAYLVQGTAGAVNPTWTDSTTATSLAAVIATFKAAAATDPFPAWVTYRNLYAPLLAQ